MIYDCIPFFNELDILKLRLHILAPYVDKFVIEEASVTFSGEPKPMIFAENREMFAEFADKILYVAVENSPMDVSTHERDKFQKNQLIRALGDCKPDDVIIFSDVDEIPNPNALTRVLKNFDASKVYHFAQRMYYCFLNMEEVSGNLLSITGEFPGILVRQWLGTKVSDGGWHFGYMGGNGEKNVAKRIGDKVKAAAHQEYNTSRYLKEAVDRLLCGEDIFGRDARFIRVEINEKYPVYLREHLKEYDYLLAPRISIVRIWWKKGMLAIKQELRKLYGKIRRS